MAVELEFQKALIAALKGDAALAAMVKKITDRKHQDPDGADSQVFPYLTLTSRFGEFDTDTGTGFDVLTQIHVWSRSGSYAEPKAIQGHVYRVLHRQDLTVPGYNVITTMREDSEVDDDPDGRTVHGTCEYRSLVQVIA